MIYFCEVDCNGGILEIAPHGLILTAEIKCPEGHVRRERRGRSGISRCYKVVVAVLYTLMVKYVRATSRVTETRTYTEASTTGKFTVKKRALVRAMDKFWHCV